MSQYDQFKKQLRRYSFKTHLRGCLFGLLFDRCGFPLFLASTSKGDWLNFKRAKQSISLALVTLFHLVNVVMRNNTLNLLLKKRKQRWSNHIEHIHSFAPVANHIIYY